MFGSSSGRRRHRHRPTAIRMQGELARRLVMLCDGVEVCRRLCERVTPRSASSSAVASALQFCADSVAGPIA
jgi:hypothetical protein